MKYRVIKLLIDKIKIKYLKIILILKFKLYCEERMNEQYSNYSKTQVNAAKGFYIAIVISLIIVIAGTVWWVADLINPSGKLSTFINLNIFYQIVIVAGFLAGFFFLLVIFIGVSKRGTKSLLHVFFNKIEIEDQLKNKIHIKAKNSDKETRMQFA